jgi:hypothetical protein
VNGPRDFSTDAAQATVSLRLARDPRGRERDLPGKARRPSPRSGIPERGDLLRARRPATTAQSVVSALVLPAVRPASLQPVSPLRLAGLHRLPRDASMLYDIGRVDDSGRVACNEIIGELGWGRDTRLDVILTPRAIVIRAAPGGLFSTARRQCLLLPSHVRRPHGIKLGDHILLAAAPEHGLVLVYPLSALDDMISRYHSPEHEAEHRNEP